MVIKKIFLMLKTQIFSTFNQTFPKAAKLKLFGSNFRGDTVFEFNENLKFFNKMHSPVFVCIFPNRSPNTSKSQIKSKIRKPHLNYQYRSWVLRRTANN